MISLLGHFHPVLVHLPIGILLLAALFEWLGGSRRFGYLRASVPLMLYLGAGSAILSCASGWLLAGNGDYQGDTLLWHRWLGVGTAALATLACFGRGRRLLCTLAAGALILTGHFGGSLTHGEHFLFAPLREAAEAAAPGIAPMADVQAAKAYQDLVAPVLATKCGGCHNAAKQKGQLRLDQPEWIRKGGKNGAILGGGDAAKSHLLQRIALPDSDDDHMPPKEKPQLTELEKILLQWWIEQGADFDKTVRDLPQSASVKAVLATLAKGAPGAGVKAMAEVPENPVAPAPAAILEQLRKQGVAVVPVAQNSAYLSANFVNAPTPSDTLLALLPQIARQLVWLKLSGVTLPPKAWATIGQLSALTRLHLDRSSCSDADLPHLLPLKNLQFLNLTGTKVSAAGVASLGALKSLRTLHLYQTEIRSADWGGLRARLPGVGLDSGGYVVGTLGTDTVRLTANKK